MALFPFDEVLWPQELEDVIPQLIVADEQSTFTRLRSTIIQLLFWPVTCTL